MLVVEHQLRDLSACDDFHYDFLDYKYDDESSFHFFFTSIGSESRKKIESEEKKKNKEGMRKWNFVRDLHFHFEWLLHYNNMLS